jgi:hypothetical protein
LELAKPGKDGLEKTKDEPMDAFSKILSHDVGITNNMFPRNAGLVASLSRTRSKFKSKSKSLPIQALKEQLDAERATIAALRAAIVRLSAKLEVSEANLRYTKENAKKVDTSILHHYFVS